MEKKGINRRKFIQGGALLTAGITLQSFTPIGMGDFPAQDWSPSKKRRIGSLEVSALGLGCMNMAGIYNAPKPKDEMIKVIRKAYENGITFFDTAEVYGPFYSEEIVSEAIAPFRNNINVASKFGFSYNGDRVTGRDSSPDHIKSAVEGMLRRLGIETLDLCYLHRMDPNVPIEDIAGTVKDLIQEGKVQNFGLSEVSPDTIRKAHAVQPVAAIQSEYSILERVMEHDILPLCEELGIAFVPWGPLTRGMLTGRFDESFVPESGYRRAGVPYFTPEALKANLVMVDYLNSWAQKKDATSGQIALAWLMAQKPFIVPIPGTTNPDHLMENIGALDVKFTQQELQGIRNDIEEIKTIGFREPNSVLKDL